MLKLWLPLPCPIVVSSMALGVGIDLGTAFVRLGVWRDGVYLELLCMPAVVAFTSDGVFIGEDALSTPSAHTFFGLKALLGRQAPSASGRDQACDRSPSGTEAIEQDCDFTGWPFELAVWQSDRTVVG